MLKDKPDLEIKWLIEGPFATSYSLAILNRELANALNDQGIDVALFTRKGLSDEVIDSLSLSSLPQAKVFYEKSTHINHSTASVVSRNHFPPIVNDMTCHIKMLHCYAWEETSFPIEWTKEFNSNLSGIAVSSKHTFNVLQNNGISVPMIISGNGVDHWEHVVADSPSQLLSDGTKSFKFLHVSSFFPRKGPDVLLEAYGRSFTGDDDVILVIKTFPNPHNRIHEQLMQMREKFSNYPSVLVIERDFTDGEMKALYSQCDVLVAPSCAEGFGLPLAEAMLSGLPVITTGWSGQMDFCNEENSWLVDYKFEQANTHFQLIPSAWAACDVDGLGSAMQLSFNTSPEIRKNMAAKGRELLLKDFTWESVAKRLKRFYRTCLSNHEFGRPKIGWVTTWNTKCGIATYSQHILDCFLDKPVIFSANNDKEIISEGIKSIGCWQTTDEDDLFDLSNRLKKNSIDILVIQFNFNFFSPEKLGKFILRELSLGIKIVIDLHSTEDPPYAPLKQIMDYIPYFSCADKLIVHTVADLNRMKNLGVVDNVVLIPHGIMKINEANSRFEKVPTIATYGFCFPHKGLLEIIDAVSLLRDQGRHVFLRMINAEYPTETSKELVKNIRNRILELDLGDQVTFDSRFLSDNESLDYLHRSDLLVFPYKPVTESSSGAVRYGLSIQKPILASDTEIFDEFGRAIWRVADGSSPALAERIWDVLNLVRTNSNQYQEKMAESRKWCNQHYYPDIAYKIENMLHSMHIQRYLKEY
ncbi:glycosyltransferase [Polynucleobacter paneuropaeus]|nr:glycosyltransferase [Polynucleobacter paneuropaeus]